MENLLKKGRSIKIFMVDGEPDGLKTVELSNWNGHAIVIPRNKLKEIKERGDCHGYSVYFLIGKKDNSELFSDVYIGKTRGLFERLSTQDLKKEFWDVAIGFTGSKLNDAYIGYLESRCIEIAKITKKYNIDNEKDEKLPQLSESEISETEAFLANLKLILSAIGYPVLEEIISEDQNEVDEPIFYCKAESKNSSAKGRRTNNGFVVYKGSKLAKKQIGSVEESNKKTISELIENDIIKEEDLYYIFIEDYEFNSPSGASRLVLGYSSNGLDYWKTADGITLKDFETKEL